MNNAEQALDESTMKYTEELQNFMKCSKERSAV